MLIRSQNKQMLVNLEKISGIEVAGQGSEMCIVARDPKTAYLLGAYGDLQGNIQVLDMIQEAYTEAEFAKATIVEAVKAFKETLRTELDEKLIEAIRKTFAENMRFQMPQDDKVKR